MEILVTGGLGYIGSNTVNLLLQNYDIVIIDNNPDINVFHKLVAEFPTKKLKLYQTDIQDIHTLNEIFSNHTIHAVIHFAGYKAVAESVKQPLSYYSNNVGATIELLKVMEIHNVKNFIFSSSGTVYGKQKSPLTENLDTGISITNPYGKTKFIVEEILKDLHHFNIWCLRYFNPIGCDERGLFCDNPNGIPNNLFPYILKVVNKEVTHLNVFGNDYDTNDGTCLRDYIHVVDVAEAHIKALQNMKSGFNVANIGTGKGISVLELIRKVETVNGLTVPLEIKDRRQGDLDIMYCDNTRATKELGWSPRHTLDDACKIKSRCNV